MESTTVAPDILRRLFSDSVERFELVDGELQPKPMVSIYQSLMSPPDQTVDGLFETCRLYHAQGVKYCWVIAPESRTAWTYHQHSEPVWIQADDSLDDAGQIKIKLTELWTGLKNKRGDRTA